MAAGGLHSLHTDVASSVASCKPCSIGGKADIIFYQCDHNDKKKKSDYQDFEFKNKSGC